MTSKNAPLIKVSDPDYKVISPCSLFDLRPLLAEGLDLMLSEHCVMTLYQGEDTSLNQKCFELSADMDWTIGKSSDGILVLIPTKKEE